MKAIQEDQRQDGFTMMVLFALLIPLLIAVAAFTTVMAGRSGEIRVERNEELALLAAESGIDHAIYRSRTGSLTHGVAYDVTLGKGQSFRVEPTHLKVDGQDNDGDGNIDEADEDVFQVIVRGTYRKSTRRLAAYLGPVPLLPIIGSAMLTMDDSIDIVLKGTPIISGHDKNIDGSAGSAPSVPGFTIASPGTISHLNSVLTGSEPDKIVGSGSAPSLGLSASFDLATLVAQLANIANLVLTSKKYTNYSFGDGSAGTANITYRDGDLEFAGNSRGAGILVVTGDLEMKGTFRFDGVIIVLGEVKNSAGTSEVYGAIIQGPGGGLLDTRGTFNLHYSSQAIALANSVSGRDVSFNGWQELAK